MSRVVGVFHFRCIAGARVSQQLTKYVAYSKIVSVGCAEMYAKKNSYEKGENGFFFN